MPEKVYDMVFSDFIDLAASKSHTPGGGNVSAAVGTLAASMVCMVANLTLANKKYADHHDEAKQAVDRLMALIGKLKDLTYEDMQAFDDYMAVFRMPKETDEDKKARVQLKNDMQAMGFTFKGAPQSTDWVWEKGDWYQVVNQNKNPFTSPANKLKNGSQGDAQK